MNNNETLLLKIKDSQMWIAALSAFIMERILMVDDSVTASFCQRLVSEGVLDLFLNCLSQLDQLQEQRHEVATLQLLEVPLLVILVVTFFSIQEVVQIKPVVSCRNWYFHLLHRYRHHTDRRYLRLNVLHH